MLDKEEDHLNMLATGHVGTTAQAQDLERRLSVSIESEKVTPGRAEEVL